MLRLSRYFSAMLWRTSKPIYQKREPSGFILPSQPTLSDKAPAGARWIHELKHDGYRLLAFRKVGQVRLWSRHATEFTGAFVRIGAAVAALPGGNLLIDGEACVLRADGHSDFHALRSRAGAASAILIGFDLLLHGGEDIRRRPLEERRAALAGLLADRDGLQFSQEIEGDGDMIFQAACRLGAEGIVSKMRDKAHQSGRAAHWLKTKNSNWERK